MKYAPGGGVEVVGARAEVVDEAEGEWGGEALWSEGEQKRSARGFGEAGERFAAQVAQGQVKVDPGRGKGGNRAVQGGGECQRLRGDGRAAFERGDFEAGEKQVEMAFEEVVDMGECRRAAVKGFAAEKEIVIASEPGGAKRS